MRIMRFAVLVAATSLSAGTLPISAATRVEQEDPTPTEERSEEDAKSAVPIYTVESYRDRAPVRIAITSVLDRRTSQEVHPLLAKHFAEGLAAGLSQRKYKDVVSLVKAQEALWAAGLQDKELEGQALQLACELLEADAVLTAEIRERAKRELVIGKTLAADVVVELRDCSEGDMLWRADGVVTGYLGWGLARSKRMIGNTLGTSAVMDLPKRPKGKKK